MVLALAREVRSSSAHVMWVSIRLVLVSLWMWQFWRASALHWALCLKVLGMAWGDEMVEGVDCWPGGLAAN
jgi:hypothetical protein